FTGGNLESTGRGLDLAISGDGFFRFQNPSGEVVYSRNGQLTMTAAGDLVNAQGARIMGYTANADGLIQAGGQPQPISAPSDDRAASATENVKTVLHLDAREVVGEGQETVQLDDGFGGTVDVNYHYSSSATVYDSLGNPHNLTSYYEKTGVNAWTMTMAMKGQALMDMDGASPPAPVAPTTTSLEFDHSGTLKDSTDVTNGMVSGVDFPSDTFFGGEPVDLTFDLNLAGSSQFG